MTMLAVVDLPGSLRILWRWEDGEELWMEYQKPCLCDDCAA